MMCHYFGSFFTEADGWKGYFFRYGFLGVELFFIISGFVIYFSLQKSLKEYVVGRAVRLLPLFWFSCTFVYVLTHFFAKGSPVSFPVYLLNMLVLTDGGVAHMVDSVYWTLTVEIIFYAGIGIFTALFGMRKLEYFYAAWLVVSLMAFATGHEATLVAKLLLVRYAPYFAFGGLLGLLYKEWSTMSVAVLIRRSVILSLAIILPFYNSYRLITHPTGGTNNFGIFDNHSMYFVASFFVIVPLAVYVSTYVKTIKPFTTVTHVLGGLTYPLYLLHQKLGLVLIATFELSGRVTWVSIAVVGGVIGISYIAYRVDEQMRKKYTQK